MKKYKGQNYINNYLKAAISHFCMSVLILIPALITGVQVKESELHKKRKSSVFSQIVYTL